jgi:hypothetical protein
MRMLFTKGLLFQAGGGDGKEKLRVVIRPPADAVE